MDAKKKQAVFLILIGITLVFVILLKMLFHDISNDNLIEKEPQKTDTQDNRNSQSANTDIVNESETESRLESMPSMSFKDILNAYASEEGRPEQSGDYDTVAHRFLEITNPSISWPMFNASINEARKRLELNSRSYLAFLHGNYADVDEEIDLIASILFDLDDLFQSDILTLSKEAYDKQFGTAGHDQYGYDLILNDPDNEQMMLKKRDVSTTGADNNSTAMNVPDTKQDILKYLAVGDAMQLPVSMVHGLRQSFLAWELSDGSHVYFDTQKGQIVDEFVLVPSFMHDKLKEKGYFLTPLTPEETIGEAYDERGNMYFESGNYLLAAKDFCKAIQLNPENVNAYLMAASAFENAGQDQDAATILNEAKKLGYGFLVTRKP